MIYLMGCQPCTVALDLNRLGMQLLLMLGLGAFVHAIQLLLRQLLLIRHALVLMRYGMQGLRGSAPGHQVEKSNCALSA
jgi:hypothetical protein